MDIWVWLLLAALTALGVALYRRSRREADAEVEVPDRGEELERERQRVGSKFPVRKMDATSYIMKHGPSANHWNEYIFCAYAGYCKEAVFLTGIPDVKESLPHV